MKTKEFLNLLENNLDKELIFEYAPTKWVGANYHITEVKNTNINSVDCGGKSDAWQETVVQLWEDISEAGTRNYLKAQKAFEIFNRVNSINPLLLETQIKFEYGNDEFHTAQLKTVTFEIQENKLIIKLHSLDTQCKARETCSPEATEVSETESCCSPATGCC